MCFCCCCFVWCYTDVVAAAAAAACCCCSSLGWQFFAVVRCIWFQRFLFIVQTRFTFNLRTPGQYCRMCNLDLLITIRTRYHTSSVITGLCAAKADVSPQRRSPPCIYSPGFRLESYKRKIFLYPRRWTPNAAWITSSWKSSGIKSPSLDIGSSLNCILKLEWNYVILKLDSCPKVRP